MSTTNYCTNCRAPVVISTGQSPTIKHLKPADLERCEDILKSRQDAEPPKTVLKFEMFFNDGGTIPKHSEAECIQCHEAIHAGERVFTETLFGLCLHEHCLTEVRTYLDNIEDKGIAAS